MVYESKILFKRLKRIRKNGKFGKGTIITYSAEIIAKDKFILTTKIEYKEYVERDIDITDNFNKALQWIKEKALNKLEAQKEFVRVWEKSK